MKPSCLLATLLVAFLLGSATTTAQTKVVDRVRSTPGQIELTIDREFSPADLSDLVQKSDLIARLLIGGVAAVFPGTSAESRRNIRRRSWKATSVDRQRT